MTRMRSPNYPAIPLEQAIGLVDKIFRADRTNVIDMDVAAEHMGYSGVTGRTQKLLGALSQYGLLDKAVKGKVRVSKTAVSILHGIDDEERKEAIATAGRSPILFRRIGDAFDQPSEKTITSFLMKEGFTDRAVAPVLRSYKLTNAFLAAQGVSESYGMGREVGADSAPDIDGDEGEDMEVDEPELPAKKEKAIFFDGGPLDFQLSTAGLSLTGKTRSPKELNVFIDKLKALAVLLPDDDGEAP